MELGNRIKQWLQDYRVSRERKYNLGIQEEARRRFNICKYCIIDQGEAPWALTYDGELVTTVPSSEIVAVLDRARRNYYNLHKKQPTAELL